MAKQKKISDPVFDEYLYTVLYNAGAENKDGLPLRVRKAINSEKAAIRFITNSTLEQKLELLAYMGIKYAFVITGTNTESIKKLKTDLIDRYQDKKEGVVRSMTDYNVYVTTNKEVTQLLTLLAQLTHTESYILNQAYQRLSYHVRDWARAFKRSDHEDIFETQELDKNIFKILLNSDATIELAPGLLKLHPSQIRLLIYLYINSNRYIPKNELWRKFEGLMTRAQVTRAVNNLKKSGHAENHLISPVNGFTITGAGIKTINNFRNTILNSNNF